MLGYVDEPGRARFTDLMTSSDAVWISQENPEVFPAFLPESLPPQETAFYLVAQDGSPRAVTAMHGGALTWL